MSALLDILSKTKSKMKDLHITRPPSPEHEDIYVRMVCRSERRNGLHFKDPTTTPSDSAASSVYSEKSTTSPVVTHHADNYLEKGEKKISPPPLAQRPIRPEAYRNPPPTRPRSNSGSDRSSTHSSLKVEFNSISIRTQSSSTPSTSATSQASSSDDSHMVSPYRSRLKDPLAGLSTTQSRWSPDTSDEEEQQQPRGRDRRRNGMMRRLSDAADGLAQRLSSVSGSSQTGSSSQVHSARSSVTSNGSLHTHPPDWQQGQRGRRKRRRRGSDSQSRSAKDIAAQQEGDGGSIRSRHRARSPRFFDGFGKRFLDRLAAPSQSSSHNSTGGPAVSDQTS
ncbi:hypothetical protein PG984_003031 [Apiospora sp. TS-2023a]